MLASFPCETCANASKLILPLPESLSANQIGTGLFSSVGDDCQQKLGTKNTHETNHTRRWERNTVTSFTAAVLF